MTEISIGICAYNEEKNIGKLLDNILTKQDLSKDSEIIVVCSGCTDSTPEIVRKFVEQDLRVKLIVEKERNGKSSAVNKILDTYAGDYIFLIPGDVIPAKSAIPLLMEKIREDPRIGVVGGSPVPTNLEKGFSGYLSHLMWRVHNKTLELLNDLNMSNHASGEFMVFKRGIVDRIPIDVVNDDAYIAVKATLEGALVKYCEEAKVYITAPKNIIDYIRQRRRVIYGHHRVKQLTSKHSNTLENMMFKEPSNTLHVLKTEIRERPKDIPKLALAIFIEVLVNFLAIIDIVLKKDHTVWTMAESTKKIDI